MHSFEIFPGENFQLLLHDQDEILSEIIREKGFYSLNDLVVFRQLLKPHSTMLEVGSNLGWHTVAMGKYLTEGLILAVEPEMKNFQLLSRNITLNELKQVKCVRAALSNYKGHGSLSLSGGNFGDHILDPQSLLDKRPLVEVEVLTGDELVSQETGFTKLDFIKIDAQGSECKILEGLKETIQKFKPAIMVEYSPRHISAAGDSVFEIFAFIEKNSYFPFQIVEDLQRPRNRLLDFVSIENLLSATKILMERGTGVDLLLLNLEHIEALKQQGMLI
ncbi:FkbM family methyltransferase [Bdellovibrio svalbardensis]|uniref:FkbM family methyltransferase n=1 Tax=Bdellovibrio svalbardensis TaxID=2972972 RepID=A0ABT6DJ00_9BACT|nr:FkbM family methyltransferase [Bdellovibrio svalbardensis]MDG0815899.1 FkbM family methyltransferase [Bdellovibrio svalbardensis]